MLGSQPSMRLRINGGFVDRHGPQVAAPPYDALWSYDGVACVVLEDYSGLQSNPISSFFCFFIQGFSRKWFLLILFLGDFSCLGRALSVRGE